MNFKTEIGQITLLIIFLSLMMQGCNRDDEPTTLEIHLQNMDAIAEQDLTVIVRINGTERPRLLPQEVLSVGVDEGVVNVGIDFTNGAGEVKFSGPHELAIESNQIQRLEIDLRATFGERIEDTLILEAVNAPFVVKRDSEYSPFDNGATIRLSDLIGRVERWPIFVKDAKGNQIDQFAVSATFTQDQGTWTRIDPTNSVYEGDEAGGYVIIGLSEDGQELNPIFEGNYFASPAKNLRSTVSFEAGKPILLEFDGQYHVQGAGKGKYNGYTLTGTAISEKKGDAFLIRATLTLTRTSK